MHRIIKPMESITKNSSLPSGSPEQESKFTDIDNLQIGYLPPEKWEIMPEYKNEKLIEWAVKKSHVNIYTFVNLEICTSTETARIYGGMNGLSTRNSASKIRSQDTKEQLQETKFLTETPANQWSTSLQNVLDQPSAVFPLRLMLGCMAFCVAFAIWAIFGQIEEVGHAQGQLVPKGEVYKIHPVDLGKVANVAVREGEEVKSGQVLVELDTQLAAGEIQRLEQVLTAYRIELNQKQMLREKSRLEGDTRVAIAKADYQARAAILAQVQQKAATAEKLLAQLQKDAIAYQGREQRIKPMTGIVQQRLKQLEIDVTMQKQQVEILKPLVESGAISKKYLWDAEQALRDRQSAITRSQLEEESNVKERVFESEQTVRDRQRTITETQGQLQQALTESQQLKAELMQKQAEIRRTEIDTQQQIQQIEVEFTQLNSKITETRNLINAAQEKLKQRFIYAPVNGIVSSLNVHHPGEVLQAGQIVAEMAPPNAPLVLAAKLPNQEAGLLKVGMDVKVKLDAYPYQDYGIVEGKVISISPDTKPDEKLGTVYKVEVMLNRNYVMANHQAIKFKSGQTGTADIIIRRRRIVDVLIEPITKMQKSGLDL